VKSPQLGSLGTTSAQVCTEFRSISVKLHKKGKGSVKKRLSLTAKAAGGKVKVYQGKLDLVCLPKLDPCVTTTTTSTSTSSTSVTLATTTTTSSTTTTSVPCAGFSKLKFSQTAGTTSCGGVALFKHCLGGDPGTDGNGSCSTDADCQVNKANCSGGPPPQPPFSGELDSANGKLADLGLGCLYIGAANAVVTPPSGNPDGSDLFFGTSCPTGSDSDIVLVADRGEGKPLGCTLGASPTRSCANFSAGTDGHGACAQDTDCPDAQSANGHAGDCLPTPKCFFGPPLPIVGPAATTCVVNVVAHDASGTANATDGSANVTIPLTSIIFLTSPDSPCPTCQNNVCVGGQNAGKACSPVGMLKTTPDCPPDGFAFVGTIPVTLAGTQTTPSTMHADDGIFCPGAGQSPDVAGAFGASYARTIKEVGKPAGNLLDFQPHPSVLAANFCIPATGSGLIDGSAGLPGPSATSLPGNMQLIASPGAAFIQ
jgi:hypothetical protein